MAFKKKRDAVWLERCRKVKERKKLKFACTYAGCDHSRNLPGELQDHIDYVHLENFKNVCDQFHNNGFKCDFKCETSSGLTRHKTTIHATDQEFKCRGCSKIFSREDSCRQHWVSTCSPLDHTGRVKHKCPICNKGFANVYDRHDHWVVNCSPENHASRTKFKCSVCSEGFPKTSSRDEHELTCKKVDADDGVLRMIAERI